MPESTQMHIDRISNGHSHSGNGGVATEPIVIPEKLCNLPPFPAVANEIFALSMSPDVDLQKIASLIERDVAFAAEILLLANSALFGFPSKVHALRHAVSILGLERMKTLAVTIAMRSLFDARTPLIRLCWRHTASCALVCQHLAKEFGVPKDLAYTAGLLHDVGRLGLLKSYPEDLSKVFSAKYASAAEVLDVERGFVHVDHGTAGAWLVKVWAFPDALSEVCSQHHDALRMEDSNLLKLVKVGCHLADAVGCAAVEYQEPIDYDQILAPIRKQLGRNGFPTLEELKSNVVEKLSAFGE